MPPRMPHTRRKPLHLWAKPGMRVRYTSPESGRIHDGIVSHTRDHSVFVRFDPPIGQLPNPCKVPIACCLPLPPLPPRNP